MVAATTITTTMTVRLPLRSPPRLGAAPLLPRRRLRQVDTPGSTSRTSRRPQGGQGQTGRHRFLRETQGKNFTNILTELEKLYFFSTNQAPLKTYFFPLTAHLRAEAAVAPPATSTPPSPRSPPRRATRPHSPPYRRAGATDSCTITQECRPGDPGTQVGTGCRQPQPRPHRTETRPHT